MMAGKKGKIIFSLFVVFAVAFVIATGVSAEGGVYPDAGEVPIEESFWYNDELCPPKASVDVEGTRVNARTKLVYPSGKERQKEKYSLNEEGRYSLVYFAESDGFFTEAKRGFTVCRHVFETEGKVRPYYGAPQEVPDRPGVIITLGNGEVFRYNRAIDFSVLTRNNPLIKMYVLPNTVGSVASRQIIYTFTDTEDPGNVLTVTQQAHFTMDLWAIYQTYIRAGAGGQLQSGWEGGTFHSGDKWGTAVKFSMHGRPETGSYKTQELNIQMDYENFTLYTNNGAYEIADLSDPDLFPKLWTGFAKGTAYLSVKCGQFNDPTSTFVITDIAGQNLADGNTAEIRDNEKPELTVKSGETIPDGIKGEPYRLFDFEVKDNLDKNPKTKVRVYMNYGSSLQSECEITGNAFVPDRTGVYTIEYSAADYYGNRRTEIRNVKVIQKREVPLGLEVVCGSMGENGEIFKPDSVKAVGAIGDYTISGEAVCVYEGREHVYKLDKEYGFRPGYAGEYKLTFRIEDYIGSYECEKTVKIGTGSGVVIPDDPILPEFMMKGAGYNLPEVYGVDYSAGRPEMKKAVISLEENGGDLAGGVLTPSVEGKTRIIYTVGNGVKSAVKKYETTVVDVGYGGRLDLRKYFYGTGLAVGAEDDFVSVSAAADTTVKFINPVDRNFIFNFNVIPEKNRFKSLTLVFKDGRDDDKKLELEFLKNEAGKNCFVRINGGAPMRTGGSFNGDKKAWTVRYDSAFKRLKVDEFVNYEAEGNLFPSGRVNISFCFNGVMDAAGIEIRRINNQVLSSSARDGSRPQISALENFSRNAEKGSVIRLPAMAATDVLDNSVEFDLTVRDPANKTVVSADNVTLSKADPGRAYEFTAESFGQYKVELNAKDSSGRKQTLFMAVNVNDVTLPVIRLNEKMPEEGRIYERVCIPGATVSDDSGINPGYYLYLERPDGVMMKLYTAKKDATGNEKIVYYDGFVPQTAGTWKVAYYVFDGSGNTEIEIYEIKVR